MNSKALLIAFTVAVQVADAANYLEVDDLGSLNLEPDEEERRLLAAAQGPDDLNYFGTAAYQAKTAAEKLDELWGQVMKDTRVAPYDWAKQPLFWTQDAFPTYCQFSDEMKAGMVKSVHTQGVVAQVAWEPVKGNPYSGIFHTGYDKILLRFSERNMITEATKIGYVPSLALKFLKDGVYAENILAMPNMTGIKSWNFFEQPMRTRVPAFDVDEFPIEEATLVPKMIEAIAHPFVLACGLIGWWEDDGTPVPSGEIHIPYELEFTSPVQFPAERQVDANGDMVMFYDQIMAGFSAGDIVLQVHAPKDPTAPVRELEHIANVRLLTDLTTSRFGDERLFFKHLQISMDYKAWPAEWRTLKSEDKRYDWRNTDLQWGHEVPASWPEDPSPAEAFYMQNENSYYGCPFAWLLPESWPL